MGPLSVYKRHIIPFLIFLVPALGLAQTFSKHTIDAGANNVTQTYAVDIDADGDMDVLAAYGGNNYIRLWKNNGDNPVTFTLEGSVSNAFSLPFSVYAADVDGDGRLDVLGAAQNDSDIAWWKQNLDGTFTVQPLIDNNFNAARSVYAADVDGDGDMDVLGAALTADDIAWYENDGSENFTKRIINSTFDGAMEVEAVDIDGDGDIDVLGAAYNANDIAWWENDGSENFTKHTIDNAFWAIYEVRAVDIDGDGDMDVLGAARYDDEIAWYENDGSENFTKRSIDASCDECLSVYAVDIDLDGDIDVVGAASNDNKIAWYENDGSENFTKSTVDFTNAQAVYAADIDGDGAMDVLGGSNGELAWFESSLVAGPTIALSSSAANLKAGETATITFTISESVSDFVVGDITVSGGTLGSFVAGSGTSYTVVFTPDASSTANGVISVADTKFTDAAGNTNADSGEDNNTSTITVDTVLPTIALSSSAANLKAGETATITFTISESVSDFVVGDITVSGGTLGSFVAGSGTSYTVVFTPDASSTANGVISVADTKFTDAAGNTNADSGEDNNTATITVDTVLPTIALSSSAANLKAGETATITFTISESVSDFVVGDITVSGGTLGSFVAGSGTSYTVVFTPDASSTANGVISVADTKFTDAAGNTNADSGEDNNTSTITVDTVLPTIALSSSAANLKAGETATITFTISESVSDFVVGDITVSGGTLGSFVAGSGTSYTVVFTPDASSTANGVISVADTKFTDAAGNTNADSGEDNNTSTITVDTVLPTIALSSSAANLKAGETATITFTISESVSDFVVGDITVSGGTLGSFVAGSGTSYTVVFTPDASSTANGVISVADTKFTDAAGNTNADSGEDNNTSTITVDTVLPTIALSSSAANLKAGETATITFTISESVSDFVVGDITVSGGTLGSFVAGSGTSYTVVFTPDASSTANGVISVADTKFTDAAGNTNADSGEDNNTSTITVDTVLPTIALSSSAANLKAGETATITFTISESVSDFVVGDITVSGGTLGSFVAGSGTSYTVVFTPDASSTANGVISVADTKFTDAAGNTNADSGEDNNTSTITVDTVLPTIALSSSAANLKAGETATITFTISESVSDFVVGDITVSGGTLGSFVAGSGTSYTVVFTPDASSTANGVISVADTKFTDAAGNTNADSGEDNNTSTITVDTVLPTLLSAETGDNNGDGTVDRLVLTFSEQVDLTSVDNNNFTLTESAGGSSLAISGSYSSNNQTSVTLTLTGVTDDNTSLTISPDYNDATGTIIDNAGNEMSFSETVAGTDKAPPAMLSAVTGDSNTDGSVDQIVVTFSEQVDLTNVDNDNFTLTESAGGNPTIASSGVGNNKYSASNATSITFNLAGVAPENTLLTISPDYNDAAGTIIDNSS